LAILQTYAEGAGVLTGTGLNGTGLLSVNAENMPGYDTTFDVVNLHLHGLQVVPLLFYPQGTGDPKADWITITPGNENKATQCFCYVFDIPEEHPMGTFFWHIHRHGSTAMQSWAGMAGMFQVGNSSTPGSPEHDLKTQGVTARRPMVLWEWAIDTSNVVIDGEPNTFFEGAFPVLLDDPTRQITFLNNNEYQPTLNMTVNETVHIPLLCAQMSTGEFEKVLSPDRQRDSIMLTHSSIKLDSQAVYSISSTKATKTSSFGSSRLMGFLTLQARPTKGQCLSLDLGSEKDCFCSLTVLEHTE
jgi:hypothetical protein